MTRAKMVAFLAIFAIFASACGIGDDTDFVRTGDGGASTGASGDSSTENEEEQAAFCQTLVNAIGESSNALEALGADAAEADEAEAEQIKLLMQPFRQANLDASAQYDEFCTDGTEADPTTSTTEVPASEECNPRQTVREILLAQGFTEDQFAFEGNFDQALLASASTNGPNSFTTPKLERGDYVKWINSDEANAVKARAVFGYDTLSEEDRELFVSGEGWVGVQALVPSVATANYTIGEDGGPEVTQTQVWEAGDLTWFFVNTECQAHSVMVRAGCGNPQGTPPKPKDPPPVTSTTEPPATVPPTTQPPVTTVPPPSTTVPPTPEMGKWCRNVGGVWTKIREFTTKLPGDLPIGHANCAEDVNEPNQPNPQDPLINDDAETVATSVDVDPEPPAQINVPLFGDGNGDGEITEDELHPIEPQLADDPDRTGNVGPAPIPGG